MKLTRRPRPVASTLAALFAASALTGGCIYSSSVKHSELPKAPERYSAAATKKRAPEVGRWWELFKDDRLNALMERAFAGNLDLTLAWARIDSARAQLELANAGWWPSLSLGADAGRSETITQFNIPGAGKTTSTITRNTLQISAGASYEIDLWGKVRHAARAARREIEASEEDLRAAYISLAALVADGYFLAASLRSQLKLLDRTIDSRERNVELVKRRYQEGVVTALDLYQAQGSLASARSQRAAFVKQLMTTEHALALLLGEPPGKPVSGTLDQLPEQVRQPPVGLPGQLLLRRPDLRAAHKRLEAADQRVGAAFAAHFPTLSLSGNVGYSFDPAGWFWSVLGSLTAPIFQGGRIAADVKLKKAVLRQALVAYRVTVLQALKEVEDALVAGKQLAEQVKWLEALVEAAEGSLRMSTDQYAQGLISFLPVLTAEQSVYTARTQLIAARQSLIAARIQLARALGGGWMDAHIEQSARERDEG